MHTTAFAIDQRRRHFAICLPTCQRCAASSCWCRGHVSCTVSVYTLLHQSPNSVVNLVSRSTGLFGGHWYGEIKFGVSCWRSWTVSRAQGVVRMSYDDDTGILIADSLCSVIIGRLLRVEPASLGPWDCPLSAWMSLLVSFAVSCCR